MAMRGNPRTSRGGLVRWRNGRFVNGGTSQPAITHRKPSEIIRNYLRLQCGAP